MENINMWWLGVLLLTPVGIVYSSFFEWMLHKHVMHKPFKIFGFTLVYAFEAHAKVHHKLFRADHTYEAESSDPNVKKIPMAWWNGPVLILIGSSPFLLLSYLTGHWWIVTSMAISMSFYYLAYEYIHFGFHIKGKYWWKEIGFIRSLNSHHLLHHRYMHNNFNVVLPLWDFILGTLRTKAW